MMTFEAFSQSLAEPAPPADGADAVHALWWAGKGDWDQAHHCAQRQEGDPACDLVHAHLHRAEGDLSNARYWYRRAGRAMPTNALPEEWAAIARELIAASPLAK